MYWTLKMFVVLNLNTAPCAGWTSAVPLISSQALETAKPGYLSNEALASWLVSLKDLSPDGSTCTGMLRAAVKVSFVCLTLLSDGDIFVYHSRMDRQMCGGHGQGEAFGVTCTEQHGCQKEQFCLG